MKIEKLEINRMLHKLLAEAEKLDAAASASPYADEQNFLRGREKGILDAVIYIANALEVTDAEI